MFNSIWNLICCFYGNNLIVDINYMKYLMYLLYIEMC